MTVVVIVIVLLYAAFHVGAGHAHYRHRRAQGLSPNFYWSSVRGPYASSGSPAVSGSGTASDEASSATSPFVSHE
jgi:hypothetical protein